jgi:hypothetical protein
MPTGIYKRIKIGGMSNKKHSEKSLQKMSKSHKGAIVTEETRRKISLGLKGFKRPPTTEEHKRKIGIGNTGKRHPNRKSPPPFTKEHLENMGKCKKGHITTEETKRKISKANSGKENGMYERRGEKNPSWKGGITPINKVIRHSLEHKSWHKTCMERDNYTCQKTGVRGESLVVHHINNFADFPELRFTIDNGITLSKQSHKEFHKKYGIKKNKKEQLEEFLKEGKENNYYEQEE